MADVESYSVIPASNTGEFPELQAPSTLNDGGRQVQADVKIAHNRINGDITAGGTADALTAAFTPVHAAHVAGRVLVVTAAAANATTTPTFTLDALAAKTITKNGGQALVAGDIYGAGHELILKDAGTNYELMNPAVGDISSGTWTPTIQDASLSDAEGQTYTANSGTYTKIGNRVFFSGIITVSSLGTLTTSSAAYIGNLPYTASVQSGSEGAVTIGRGTQLSITAGTSLSGNVATNTDYILLYVWESATGIDTLKISEVTASGYLTFSGHYVT